MEKPLKESGPLPTPNSVETSLETLTIKTDLTGTIFPSTTALLCDVFTQINNPLLAEAESLGKELSLGSPRALGKHEVVGGSICNDHQSPGKIGLSDQLSHSPPAGTALESNSPDSAVGATNYRSPVAPGVALFQSCMASETASADLQQEVHIPSGAFTDLQGDSPAKAGISPHLGHSSSLVNVSNISTIAQLNASGQTLTDYNYGTKEVVEILAGHLEQASTSRSFCVDQIQDSTPGGAPKQNLTNKTSNDTVLLQLNQGNILKRQNSWSFEDKKLNNNNNANVNKKSDNRQDGSLKPPNDLSVHNIYTGSNHLPPHTTTGALTYANVVAPPNIHKNPTTGFTKDCAVIMERLQATSLDTYIEALWETMQQKAVTYIGQAPDDPLSVLAFVKSQDLASILIQEGIWIGWKWVKVSGLEQQATKIVISGALPFISDETIAQQLSTYGKLAYSQFRRIPAATRTASHKGILSFRREAFIILYEQKQIPERITLLEDGKLYTLEVSSEGPKCYTCGQRGHLAIKCEKAKERDRNFYVVGRPPPQQTQDGSLKQFNILNTIAQNITSEEEEGEWTDVKARKKKLQKPNDADKSQKENNIGGNNLTNVVYHTQKAIRLDTRKRLLSGKRKQSVYKSNTFITHSANLAGKAAITETSESKKKSYGNEIISQSTTNTTNSMGIATGSQRTFISNLASHTCEVSPKVVLQRINTPELRSKKEAAQDNDLSRIHKQKPQTQSTGQDIKDSKSSQIIENNSNSQAIMGNQLDIKTKSNEVVHSKETNRTTDIIKKHNGDCNKKGSTEIISTEVQELDMEVNQDTLSWSDGQAQNESYNQANLYAELDPKQQQLIEQLISESKSLRVTRRKELVKKYAEKMTNLKLILQSMVEQENNNCCPKGSPPFKRILMIIEDLDTMDRVPKTRAENRRPSQQDENFNRKSLLEEEVEKDYWKKYPPEISEGLDRKIKKHEDIQDPVTFEAESLQPFDISEKPVVISQDEEMDFQDSTTTITTEVVTVDNQSKNSQKRTDSIDENKELLN